MEILKSKTHEYAIFSDSENVSDMKHVFTQFCKNHGYIKIKEMQYDGDTILIAAKKIK